MLLSRGIATTRKSVAILASVSAYYEHACPHATKEEESDDEEVCMSAYSCMCPHTAICMSAYYHVSAYMCVRILLRRSKARKTRKERESILLYSVSPYYNMCPHTTMCRHICVSAYY